MTLKLTQGHRVKGQLELVHPFCCEVHEATPNFVIVEYVIEIEMTVKMSLKVYHLSISSSVVCCFGSE